MNDYLLIFSVRSNRYLDNCVICFLHTGNLEIYYKLHKDMLYLKYLLVKYYRL